MAKTNRIIFKGMIASWCLAIGCVTLHSMARHDPAFHLAELSAQIMDQPQNPVLFFERGEIHRARREYEKALADYKVAEKLDPDMFVIDLARGRTLYEYGRSEDSLPALDRFLACLPNDGEANLICAQVLTSLGFHWEADEKFAKAMTLLERRLPDHYLEWAQCRERFGAGGIPAALDILNQGIDEFGPIVSLQLPALELELKIGRTDEALHRVDQLIAISHRKEIWLFRKGQILANANRPLEAAELIRQTLEAIQRLPRRHQYSNRMKLLRADVLSELRHLESLIEIPMSDSGKTEPANEH